MPPSSALPGFEPTQHYQRHARVALTPGSRVGEFEIVRVLGVGGFSIVYLARDLALNRLVALKEYLPSALALRGEGAQVALRTASGAQTFEQGLDSFIKEARMLARFDHPSLVRVHHFWRANGTAYMAMRYLEGVTLLAARRAMLRPPDEAWLRALIGSLLGAVETLHAESCFHRDISPDNILLLPDATPVLLDFGAARSISGDGSQQLTAILKPGFAPIEQYAEAADLRQGPWTDIYALGAVVRNCITARPPIPSTVRAVGDRLPSLALEVRTLAATFPGLDYSPAFLAAIDWALALRPADRPQSVAQFRQALALEAAGPVGVRVDGPRAATPAPLPTETVSPSVLGGALSGARRAVASLRVFWPTAAVARRPVDTGSPMGGPVRSEAPGAASPPPQDRPAHGARLRRALPWSVAAVLSGIVASAGWRSFEEHQVGRDMAVIASSAAVAAGRAVTPAAFAAPPGPVEDDRWVIDTLSPGTDETAAEEPPADAAARDGQPVDHDEGMITESREPAADARTIAPLPSTDGFAAAVARSSSPALPRANEARRAGPLPRAGPQDPPRRKTSAAAIDSPRRICARQERYTDYVCMQRQCALSRFRGHAQCASLRKTGWWGFIRLP